MSEVVVVLNSLEGGNLLNSHRRIQQAKPFLFYKKELSVQALKGFVFKNEFVKPW